MFKRFNWTKVKKWAFTAAGAVLPLLLPKLPVIYQVLQGFHAPGWALTSVGGAVLVYKAFKQDPNAVGIPAPQSNQTPAPVQPPAASE